jgi:hypothetical protein
VGGEALAAKCPLKRRRAIRRIDYETKRLTSLTRFLLREKIYHDVVIPSCSVIHSTMNASWNRVWLGKKIMVSCAVENGKPVLDSGIIGQLYGYRFCLPKKRKVQM